MRRAVALAVLLCAAMAAGAGNCSTFAGFDFQCSHPGSCSVGAPHQEASAAACAALCQATSGCYAAAWNGPVDQTCYMKPEGTHPVRDCSPTTTGIVCRGKVPTLPTHPPCPPSPPPSPPGPHPHPHPGPPPAPVVPCDCNVTAGYSATIVARSIGPGGGSVVSKANGSSTLEFNFNPTWFPGNGAGVQEGLVVRVQDNNKYPWWGAAGGVAIVPLNVSADGMAMELGRQLTDADICWPGVAAPTPLPTSICNATGQKAPSQCEACAMHNPDRSNCWGAIDPRIAYRPATKTYHLGWDNCSQDCGYRQTQHSTTTDPYSHTSWVHHGPVLGNTNRWDDQTGAHQASTAGASFMFDHEPGKHLVFVATGSIGHPQWEQVLMIANASGDALHWDTMTCNATVANQCCHDTSPAAKESSPSPCLDRNCCSPTPVCEDPISGNCRVSLTSRNHCTLNYCSRYTHSCSDLQ